MGLVSYYDNLFFLSADFTLFLKEQRFATTIMDATEEQSATMEEIAAASHALTDMSVELTVAVRKFKV